MIANIGLKAEEFQDLNKVKENELMICPICFSRLHGHGWRNRYVCDGKTTQLIKIHRKICSNCRKTITFLPDGVHVNKIYISDVIIKVVTSFYNYSHLLNKIKISKILQKSWIKSIEERIATISSVFSTKQKLEYIAKFECINALFSKPKEVQILTDVPSSLMMYKQTLQHPHQRLYLSKKLYAS